MVFSRTVDVYLIELILYMSNGFTLNVLHVCVYIYIYTITHIFDVFWCSCMSQVIHSYGKTGNETLIWVKLGPCNLAFLLDANWWENMLDRSGSPGPSSEGISRVLSLQVTIDCPRNNSPTEHICYKQKHMGVSWNGGTPKMLDRLERKTHL